MGMLCYTCGWRKTPTASETIASDVSVEASVNGDTRYIEIQLAVKCGHCGRFTAIRAIDFLYPPDKEQERIEEWDEHIRAEGVIVLHRYHQEPALFRPCPSGAPGYRIQEAWDDAERAFATRDLATPAGMAYRRVIDVAIRAMTNDQKSKKPLGVRVHDLLAAGAISKELADLIDQAKAFGDEAAHGMPLRDKDAAIARDLCEAFLRQAFTIPHLTSQIKIAIAEREAQESEPEIPF